MNKEDIIRMAREAGAAMIHGGEHALMGDFALEAFFQKAYAAGAAAERNRTWTQGHWTEYERSIAAAEREACAKVCDEVGGRDTDCHAWDAAAAIRARGNT